MPLASVIIGFIAVADFLQALVRPNFTRAQVADLNTFETHIKHLIAKIPRDGSTVDLQRLFFQLTLDSATEFLFGESLNSLDSKEGSEQDIFGKSFDLAQSRLGTRSRLGKLIWLFRDKDFDMACEIVHDFVDQIVHKGLEKVQPVDAEKSVEANGKPERYVFLTEMIKSTRNPKQLRAELLNILLAGRDTTASLLSHTFHVLARRSDIWRKLKAEVDELQGAKPDYETLRQMKYLKYLLNECKCFRPVTYPESNKYSLTTVPCCSRERTIRQQRHNSSTRRRSRWPIAYFYRQGEYLCLLSIRYAPSKGYLRA